MNLEELKAQIIGSSFLIQKIREIIITVVNMKVPIVIEGNTGTGKTLTAHIIHKASGYADDSLEVMCCGSTPEIDQRINILSNSIMSNHQTSLPKAMLFEELGDLPETSQVKLSNYFDALKRNIPEQQNTVHPVIKCLFTTTIELSKLLEEKRIRPDLFYRLGSFIITVPPLKDRKADIPELTQYFLQRYTRKYNKTLQGIEQITLSKLIAYSWPGNVRELENAIEYAVLTAKQECIISENLPKQFTANNILSSNKDMQELVKKYELQLINEALKESRGNVAGAAKILKTTERIIGYKLKNYKINSKDYKV